MYTSSFRRVSLLLLALTSGEVAAVYSPLADYRYVGAGCTYTTIQAAIDTGTLCPGTRVVVTNTEPGNPVLYTGQAITIQDKSLIITGSRNACGSQPPVCDPSIGCGSGLPEQIKIVGNGAAPVFTIRGNSNVSFANLDISGGKGGTLLGAPGGGISQIQTGNSLSLRNVSVHHNTSGYGGGIGFYGAGGTLSLDGVYVHHNAVTGTGTGGGVLARGVGLETMLVRILDNPLQPTQFSANSAYNGGGLNVSGNLRLDALSRQLLFENNSATTQGGALFVEAGAQADVGGAGMVGNHAFSGGAVAVSGDNATCVRLFSIDAVAHPLFRDNYADGSIAGGAIVVSADPLDADPLVCVFDTGFRNNYVPSGRNPGPASAAVIGVFSGSVRVNPADDDARCDFAGLAQRGARHCAPAVSSCNRAWENSAPAEAGVADDGALFSVSGGALQLRRLKLEANNAGHAVKVTSGTADIGDCLVHHNTFTKELLLSNGTVAIDSCTFADDANANAAVFNGSGPLAITRSIVREAKPVFPGGSANLTAQYSQFNLPVLAGISNVLFDNDPGFVDAANGDYHLSGPAAVAVNVAPAAPSSSAGDLDRQPRVVDLDSQSSFWGLRDLGPYEYQEGGVRDRIFLDTFEP